MISKFFKDKLDSTVREYGSLSKIVGRCSGDSYGARLSIIGDLMQKDKPYTYIFDKEPLKSNSDREFNEVCSLIANLKLEHFVCTRASHYGAPAIYYEPWLDE